MPRPAGRANQSEGRAGVEAGRSPSVRPPRPWKEQRTDRQHRQSKGGRAEDLPSRVARRGARQTPNLLRSPQGSQLLQHSIIPAAPRAIDSTGLGPSHSPQRLAASGPLSHGPHSPPWCGPKAPMGRSFAGGGKRRGARVDIPRADELPGVSPRFRDPRGRHVRTRTQACRSPQEPTIQAGVRHGTTRS
jgi:hypothetical protein